MRTDGPKRAFFKKRDLLWLAALLALAALLFFLLWPKIRPARPVAQVSVGVGENQTSFTLDLEEEGVVEVEGGRLPVQLQVQNGGIQFVNSVCPDHLCEGFGLLKNEGEWASCLPAEVFVRVEAG